MSKVFAYSIISRLEVADVSKFEKDGGGGHDWDLKINGASGTPVPKNMAYTVTVTIPAIRPTNLVPLATPLDSGLLVHASVFKTASLAGVKFDNLAGVGVPEPGSHPQRRSQHASKRKSKPTPQTFSFPPGNFTASSKVVFVFQSVCVFYDDNAGGVPFAKPRPIIKVIQRDVSA